MPSQSGLRGFNRLGSGCRMFRTWILTVLREHAPELRAASYREIE